VSRLDCQRRVKALWEEKWPVYGHPYPVLWNNNVQNLPIPEQAETDYWLHMEVDFGVEQLVAFGNGRFSNERRLYAMLGVRVFSAISTSDTFGLQLLDDALKVYRSERRDTLSFIGDIGSMDEGGTEDGAWYERSARLMFEFRFSG
jgi:hypothetical protein